MGLDRGLYEIDDVCLQICATDGLEFDIEAHPVEEIGLDVRTKHIDAIIVAIGLVKSGIKSKSEDKLERLNCAS